MKYGYNEINEICPICGSRHVTWEGDNDELNTIVVYCENCGAESYGKEAEAIEKWNNGDVEIPEEE